jgi:hypothetical protein
MTKTKQGKAVASAKKQNQSQQHDKLGHKTTEKKDLSDIPVLKLGQSMNNFTKFKEALLTAALIEFGDVGKLIQLGEYYDIARPEEEDYEVPGNPRMSERMYEMACVEWMKEKNKMKSKRAGLYGFIWRHLSLESRDKMKEAADFDTWDNEKDPEKLWQEIVRTHKVNTTSGVSAIKQRSARATYLNCHQGGFESLVSYKERHVAAYKSYKDEGNPEIDEESRAMDFFDGLDRSKYGDFNNHIMNCIETGTLTPPKDLSTVYGWASNWKRTHNVRDRTSQAAAFVTTEEKDKQGKETHDTPPKLEKDWTNIKCFRCKKKGHGAKWCPEKEAQRKEAERKSAEGNVHLVWADANVMATYSVLSATDEKLAMSNDEILLDTQANISLFHPSILRDVQESEREVRVNGVGGYQMTVSKKGYLPGFFDVYCHDEVKVNILCFADVEDLYEVVYQPSVGFVVHVDGKEIIFQRRDK